MTIPATVQKAGSAAVPLYVEYDKRLRAAEQLSALDSELFGDSVSLYSGQTEFNQVDIDIPGNNALPVQLRRRFAITSLVSDQSFDPNGGIGNPYGGLSNWDIEVPHLYGIFDSFNKWNIPNGATTQQPRCSNYFYPRVAQPGFTAKDVWAGFKVHVPGKGEKEMLRLDAGYPPLHYPTDGRSPTWTTTEFDAFRCIASPTASGEGFVMTTPDGVSYTFDVYMERSYPSVTYGGQNNPRVAVFLLASKVSDRYGNEVRYTYNGLGHPTLIEGWTNGVSDGRRITLAYDPANPSQLKTATAAASLPAQPRTWTYDYQVLAPDNTRRLTSVTLPDNVSQWTFDYTSLNTPTNTYMYVDYWAPDITGPTCAPSLPSGTGGNFGLLITHPSGSKGEFRFSLRRHARTNLPSSNCVTGPGGAKVYGVSPFVDAFRLDSKTVFTTDATSDLWTYTYGGTVPGQPHRVRTTVTPPDGSVQRHDFSSAYGATIPGAPAGVAIEGTLLETSTLQGGVPLRAQTNTYFTGPDTSGTPFTGQLFPSRYGLSGGGDDPASSSLRPLKTVTTTQQGVTFTRNHVTFDNRARPLQVERKSALAASGAPLYSKTETTVYTDYPALWILGLIDTVSDSTLPASPVVDNDYDTIGNVTQVKQFGRVERTTTWNLDGTLATITEGPNTTVLGSFKRGIPQSVTYADSTSIGAAVDDAGDIRSVTDENGYTTNYGYDLLRRLTSIQYPIGDAIAWNNTTIQYDRVGTDPTLNIQGTHWRQTTSTGNARKVTHLDQRLRPIVTHEYDTANLSGTQRYVRRGYDYANRETFAGYPSTSASATAGKTTTYDALGRIVGTAQDAEAALGTLTTTTRYLNPFVTEFENARGKITSTTYQVFDEPSESAPLAIAAPLGVTTTFTRDVFGKSLTMVRSGTYGGSPISATRRYVYDAYQRLCKTIEPESGATVLSYNNADLVEWKASGQSLTSTTNCQQASVAANQKVSYTYDGRERLLTTAYGDGSPGVTRTYTLDGLPYTIASDSSTWTTTYNKRRLSIEEKLTLDASAYPIAYAHTANGHVASMTYPDATILAYAPNALGEATQVGNYATQVTTHPNGALASFRYGNNILHTTSQNTRGLPSRSVDGSVLDDSYTYDANGNVTGITDALATNFSRTMAYDDLDRLSTATNAAQWAGTETYTYDPLDNLRAMVTPGLNWTHNYDAPTWRLLNIADGASNIITYNYDTRGRVTTRTVGASGQTFTIDLADRVRQITGLNPTTYRYDGHGRRMTVTRGSGWQAVQIHSQNGQLLYQGPRAEDRSSPIPKKRYIYLGRHLIAEDGTAGRQYLHTDGLGSPVRTTSTSGVPSAREIHHPYGWGPTTNSTPGFTGHVADNETGLSYMQARYYDPYAGRFLAVDPVDANAASFNRYWYANNSPYKFVDPDGRNPLVVAAAVVAGIDYLLRPSIANAPGLDDVTYSNTMTAPEVLLEVAGSLPLGKFGAVIRGVDQTQQIGSRIRQSSKTEPTLPAKVIAEGNGVKVTHNYKSDDHAPAHAHVTGGGRTTRIGPNGKPLAGDAELSPAQKKVVEENKSAIRSAVRKIGRWLNFHKKD